jgi:regulator of sigma E protease
MGIFLLIVGLILFIGLVVVHEWGHFIAARRGGVTVEEFGIFFPPRLYKRKTKGGWNFTINALPLGGFVKLKGEHDSDTEKGSYGAAPTRTKVRIMLAGVFMNLVTAIVLFTVLALVGMPKLIDNQFTVKGDTKVVSNNVLISYIEPNSPASKAGLQPRDQLKKIGDTAVASSASLPNITKRFAGKPVAIVYVRDGQTKSTNTTLRGAAEVEASKHANNKKGYLGVEPTEFTLQRSTWSAPIVALGLSAQFTMLTYQGLGHALAGLGGIFAGAITGNHDARENAQTTASSQVSGPVGIFVILKDGSLLGYQFMLLIIAIISLTLAIMNVLPIPALDGGRLFVTLISRITKKRISPQTEEAIYGTGFAVLMLLIIIITVVDIKRFF